MVAVATVAITADDALADVGESEHLHRAHLHRAHLHLMRTTGLLVHHL
jgi:hypothetical protein